MEILLWSNLALFAFTPEAVEQMSLRHGGLAFVSYWIYCWYKPCHKKFSLCRFTQFFFNFQPRETRRSLWRWLCFGVKRRALCLCTLVDPQISDVVVFHSKLWLWLWLWTSQTLCVYRLSSPLSLTSFHTTNMLYIRRYSEDHVETKGNSFDEELFQSVK